MSYSHTEAKSERALDIELALHTRNADGLRYFALLEKQEGNDEYAEALFESAKRIEKEDHDDYWAYDEAEDNKLQGV